MPDKPLSNAPSSQEPAPKRFSALRFFTGALAVCSFATPFAMHLQVKARAAGPQVAVLADLSQPDFPSAVRTVAGGLQTGENTIIAMRTDGGHTQNGPDFGGGHISPQGVPAPSHSSGSRYGPAPLTYVSVLLKPYNPDIAPQADLSATPPPLQTGQATGAPGQTPLPSLRSLQNPPLRTARDIQAELLSGFEKPGEYQGGSDRQAFGPPSVNDGAIETAELPPLTAAPSVQDPLQVRPVTTAEPSEPDTTDIVYDPDGPKIALVIAAAGINENVTRFAIDALPAGVTLAFAPVNRSVADLAREAKDDGHTVLVEIPMEPVNKNRDPGPLTLRITDTPQENLSRLQQALQRVPVADGASSYLGARFNADAGAATPVIQALAQQGLFFFENEPTSRSLFKSLAASSSLPYARGIVKIDRNRGSAAIRDALNALEQQARKNGHAVGVGTAFRGTISTIELWAKAAQKRGVQFVSVAEIAK